MARRKPRRFLSSLLQGMWWPTFWGVSASVGIYFALSRGWLADPAWQRYLAGHWIEIVEVTLFCVGLSALAVRAWELFLQFAVTPRIQLEPIPADGVPLSDAPRLLATLESLPERLRESWLAQRLRQGLDFIHRQQSTEELDGELKNLSEEAADTMYDKLALARIIIWAEPMLGFLGTVMGITMALGQLSPQALVSKPDEAMNGLLSSLSVAFDTTALALIMSITMMFIMYMINQAGSELLREIDEQAHGQLACRFQSTGSSRDPEIAWLRQLATQMTTATEQLVQRQAELWQKSFDKASQHWQGTAEQTKQHLESGLRESLQKSLVEHSQRLSQLHDHSEQRVQRWWQELQSALQKNGELLERQQSEMLRQGDILARTIEATGEVVKLEHVLNRNLRALAGSKNFEDTVMSLSAAIHLLNSRIGVQHRVHDALPASLQGKAA